MSSGDSRVKQRCIAATSPGSIARNTSSRPSWVRTCSPCDDGTTLGRAKRSLLRGGNEA